MSSAQKALVFIALIDAQNAPLKNFIRFWMGEILKSVFGTSFLEKTTELLHLNFNGPM